MGLHLGHTLMCQPFRRSKIKFAHVEASPISPSILLAEHCHVKSVHEGGMLSYMWAVKKKNNMGIGELVPYTRGWPGHCNHNTFDYIIANLYRQECTSIVNGKLSYMEYSHKSCNKVTRTYTCCCWRHSGCNPIVLAMSHWGKTNMGIWWPILNALANKLQALCFPHHDET